MIPLFINGIHELKEKIFNKRFNKLSEEIHDIERKITLFHAKIIQDFKFKSDDIIVGFHGQTIYHNSEEKISNN